MSDDLPPDWRAIDDATPPEPDDVRRDFEERIHVEKPAQRAPVIIRPTQFVWRDPKTIPPREFVYGKHYIRKFVSGTVAPGGVGKSSLDLVEAVAMAAGKPLLGVEVPRPLNVWVWNGEDPKDEIERRIAAILLHYGLTGDDLGGRLFYDSGRELGIKIATVERGSVRVAVPVADALVRAIAENRFDAVIVDPFVSCHSVPENDNPAIDVVVKEFGRIADSTRTAIELVHHVRKTGGEEVKAEDARGGSSFGAGLRALRVANRMTEAEHATSGVDCRGRYFWTGGPNEKHNLTPPSEKKSWFRLESIELGNGDDVQVLTSWKWPDPLEGMTTEDLRIAQRVVAEGECRADSQAKDWAGHSIGRAIGVDTSSKAGREKVKALIRIWTSNKMFRLDYREDEKRKRPVPYLVVGDLA